MTVILELKPEFESLLEKRARAEGCDVKGYVERLVEKEVKRERTFDEILAPFRKAVEKSGVSDEVWIPFSLMLGERSRKRDERGSKGEEPAQVGRGL